MSLPLVVALSGLSGVFVVMCFLLVMINLSSKVALSLEKKAE